MIGQFVLWFVLRWHFYQVQMRGKSLSYMIGKMIGQKCLSFWLVTFCPYHGHGHGHDRASRSTIWPFGHHDQHIITIGSAAYCQCLPSICLCQVDHFCPVTHPSSLLSLPHSHISITVLHLINVNLSSLVSPSCLWVNLLFLSLICSPFNFRHFDIRIMSRSYQHQLQATQKQLQHQNDRQKTKVVSHECIGESNIFHRATRYHSMAVWFDGAHYLDVTFQTLVSYPMYQNLTSRYKLCNEVWATQSKHKLVIFDFLCWLVISKVISEYDIIVHHQHHIQVSTRCTWYVA